MLTGKYRYEIMGIDRRDNCEYCGKPADMCLARIEFEFNVKPCKAFPDGLTGWTCRGVWAISGCRRCAEEKAHENADYVGKERGTVMRLDA